LFPIALMLSLPLGLLRAQSDSLIARVENVFVLRPGSSFINRSDSTYYAIPRYRLERIEVKAELSDSIRELWARDRERLLAEIDKQESNVSFWRYVSTSAGLIALLEAVVRILK
jgi:hypothetical protein